MYSYFFLYIYNFEKHGTFNTSACLTHRYLSNIYNYFNVYGLTPDIGNDS